MTTVIQNPYANYADKVLAALEIALDRKEMDDTDVVAALIQFGDFDDLDALKAKVEELSQTYPSLKEVLFLEKQETSESFDDIVQKYITYLIQNGRASEVNSVSAEIKTLPKTIAALTEKYPELNQLI